MPSADAATRCPKRTQRPACHAAHRALREEGVGRRLEDDAPVGVCGLAERDDGLNEGRDCGNEGPAEDQIQDAEAGPAGIEVVDAKTTEEEREEDVGDLLHRLLAARVLHGHVDGRPARGLRLLFGRGVLIVCYGSSFRQYGGL